MGKRKWRRVSLADLARPEEQGKLLGTLDRATGQPEADSPGCCNCDSCSCGKRASETPATGR